MGINFAHFNRRENRFSLAIFYRKEIMRFCGGTVKITAGTAENRAILVRLDSEL